VIRLNLGCHQHIWTLAITVLLHQPRDVHDLVKDLRVRILRVPIGIDWLIIVVDGYPIGIEQIFDIVGH
jgi:hypothetical protein